jgi:hypothetical protein
MKMKGLINIFIYKPYCKKKETNQAGYQEANNHPKMQVQLMKNMMRNKNLVKIQPKKGFLSLCNHLTVMTKTQEDSTTIKTYQENTKQSNQENNDDVRDYLRKNCVCMCPIE